MTKKTFLQIACLIVVLYFSLPAQGFAQTDNIAQTAIDTVRGHMGLPPGMEIKFIEKKESPAPGFYSVKLLLTAPDRQIPIIIYVDKAGEKVFLGNLIVRGENVTRKDMGEVKPRKVDLTLLKLEESPFRGPAQAKVTVVEFSNFYCSYCVQSWKKMKDLLEKYPQDIKYVFKHFPIQSQTKTRELAEMVAAAQKVSNEAFWVLHDFFFSDEGQAIINNGKEALRLRIEIILKQKGVDVSTFQAAYETMYGKSKVDEDVAMGTKIGVNATPSTIINGDFVRGLLPEKTIERYLGR